MRSRHKILTVGEAAWPGGIAMTADFMRRALSEMRMPAGLMLEFDESDQTSYLIVSEDCSEGVLQLVNQAIAERQIDPAQKS